MDDKTIIISNYDNGYQWSIYKDCQTYYRDDWKPCNIEFIYKTYTSYADGGEKVKERFPDYTVIICDNGCIDIYERNNEDDK